MHYIPNFQVRLLFFFCFLLGSYWSSAQQHQLKIDSLKKLLNNDVSLQEKASIHNTLGSLYQKQKKPDTALHAYQQALKYTDTVKTSVELATLYENIGGVFYEQLQYKDALSYYFKSLAVKQQLNDVGKVGILYFNIGIIYRDANDYPKAVEYYHKALEVFLHDKKTYKYSINVYQNLGIVHRKVGNFDKAIAQHEKAIEVSQKLKLKVWIAHGQNSLGNAYYQQGKYKDALRYYHQALEFYRTAKNKVDLATCEANIVNIYLLQGNPKAAGYMDRSLKIFKKYKLREHEAKVYNDFGKSYRVRGMYQEALKYYQKNLEIRKQIKYKKGIAATLRLMGNIYKLQGNYSKAMKCFREGLMISEQLGDNFGKSALLLNIGNWHFTKGAYVKALQYYQKSLHISEKINRVEGINSVYKALSALYQTQGDFAMALVFARKNLGIHRKNQHPLGGALSSVAYGYYLQGDYKQALKYYQQALRQENITQRQTSLAFIYYGLGTTNLARKNFSQAESYLLRSWTLRQMLGEQLGLASTEVALGKLNYQEQNHPKALKYLRSAVGIARSLNVPSTLREGSRYLAEVYEALGDYKAAYQNHKLYKELADSLLNQKNTRKIAQLESQYIYKKKQDSLKVIQAKNEGALQAEIRTQKANQRTTLIGVGLLGILLAVLALFYRSKQLSNHLLASTNAQLLSLDRFKQQMMGMIVHDLKNPLNAIIGLSEAQQDPQFFTTINRSGKRMQHLVLNILDVQRMEDQQMPLKKETVLVADLIQAAVHQVSFVAQEKNQQISIVSLPEVSLEVDPDLLTRVLVNLLSNATQYVAQNGEIQVMVEIQEGHCKISVSDNGVGIAPEFLNKVFDKYQQAAIQKSGWMRSTGLGLTFCKLTIEAHKGEIGVVSELGKGSTFWFTLPLKQVSLSTSTNSVVSQVVVQEDTFNFTLEERQILQSLVAKISQYRIYQTGEIVPLLATLDQTTSVSLKNWQVAMEDAIFAYNKAKFEALLQDVNTPSSVN